MFLKKLLLASVAMAALVPVAWAELPADGEYLIQNVETGYYLGGGNEYGTHASLIREPQWFSLTVSGSGYVLNSNQNRVDGNGVSNTYLGTNLYCDSGSAVWTIEEVEDGVYTISNTAGYITGNGKNSVVSQSETVSETAKWKLVTKEDIIAQQASASSSNPVDVTALISGVSLNPYINVGGYWTSSEVAFGCGDSNASHWANVAEAYHAAFSATQTLSNMKAGYYRLDVQGFYRDDRASGADKTAEPYVLLGDAQANIPERTGTENWRWDAYTAFQNNTYPIETLGVTLSEAADLTLGVKGTATDKWVVWGCFSLLYYGDSKVTDVYNGTVSRVKEYIASNPKLETSVLESLSALVADDAVLSGTATDAEYLAASKKMDDALASAQASEEYYASAAVTLAAHKTFLETNNLCTAEAYKTYQDSYNTYLTAYENGTLVTGTDLSIDKESVMFGAWSVTSGTVALQYNTWSTEDASDGSGFSTPFVEIWNGGVLPDETITGTVTGLENGKYQVTMNLRCQQSSGDITGVSVNLNGGTAVEFEQQGSAYKADNGCVSYLQDITVEGNVLNGTLKLNVVAKNTTTGWISFKNVHYTKIADINEEEVKATYEAALATAKNLASQPMPADDLTALQGVIDENGSASDLEGYSNSAIALQAANETAQISVDAYASFAKAYESVIDIVNTTNVYTESGVKTYRDPYDEAKAKYDAGTLSIEDAAATVNPHAALGWHADNTVDDLLLELWGQTNYDGSLYINTWSNEGLTDGSGFSVPFFEYWIADGSVLGANTWTATIPVSDKTKAYNVEALVRVRYSNGQTVAPYGISLKVGDDGEAVNVCDGTPVDDSQFYIGTYKATGRPDSDGNLKVNFVIDASNNVSWLAFKNVVYSEAETADAGAVAALKNTLSTLEKSYTENVGFDKGEYAPYNNFSTYNSLKEIQALVAQENVSEEELAAAQALYDASPLNWVANTEEVNAIYDGTFVKPNTTNLEAPIGWTMTEGRAFGGTARSRVLYDATLSEFGTDCVAFYTKFDGTYDLTSKGGEGQTVEYYYGKTEGYTMPLKANTVYCLKTTFKGWGSTNVKLNLSVSGPDDYTSVGVTAMAANDANAADDVVEPTTLYVPFKTGAAGNYIVTLKNVTGSYCAAVSRGYELYTLQPQTREIKTNGIGTICLPYAFTATGADIYAVSGVEDNTVKLTKVETAEPGVAYIYQATADAQTFEIADEATVLQEPVSAGYLNGVFTQTTVDKGNYVLQDHADGNGAQFYKVNSGDIVLSPFRAYLSVPAASSGAALRISFDGETTGVEAVKALTDENAVIYDLNGRKLNRLQKGINVVNGVKVFVK